jgi:hypothetical protein
MKKLFAVVPMFATLALGGPVLAQDGPGASVHAAYALKVDAPPAKKGQQAVAKIKITPGAGFHINKEYPTSLALHPPAGVTVAKSKLGAKDAARWEEKGGEFDVSYTAKHPGKQVVTGELKFAVCSVNSCNPQTSTVSFEIDVK